MESTEDAGVEVDDNNLTTTPVVSERQKFDQEDTSDDALEKPTDSGTDIFEDVSDGEELFESNNSKPNENTEDDIFGLDEKPVDLREEDEDIAGIDNKDIFGSNTQECDDLFADDDEDDDEDASESNMHGAIPVRLSSGSLIIIM